MVLPIFVIGSPVLRKVAIDIDNNYNGLSKLLEDMRETLPKADGVGLAAPQVGHSIRLFIIDGSAMAENNPEMADFKKIFINAHIIEEEGEEWVYNEGCLSVPTIREDIKRKPKLRIKYLDENFEPHDEVYEGIKARVIQHEYDHIEGLLIVDYISPLKRRLLKAKITNISRGKVETSYKINYPDK